MKELLNNGANPFLVDQVGREAKDYHVATVNVDKTVCPIPTLVEDAKKQWLT